MLLSSTNTEKSRNIKERSLSPLFSFALEAAISVTSQAFDWSFVIVRQMLSK
jgi:hypothetical protein